MFKRMWLRNPPGGWRLLGRLRACCGARSSAGAVPFGPSAKMTPVEERREGSNPLAFLFYIFGSVSRVLISQLRGDSLLGELAGARVAWLDARWTQVPPARREGKGKKALTAD